MRIAFQIISVFSLSQGTIAYSATFPRNVDGLTELHLAAGKGDTEEIRKLIKAGADVLALDSHMGVSVLHKAVYSGNPDAVKVLIENGALIDLQSPSNGNTALHDALYFKSGKDLRIIKLLLEKGASLALRNRAGFTPSESADLLKDRDSVEAIRKEYDNRYPVAFRNLMDAVRKNDLAKVKKELGKKSEIVNLRDEQGFSPLIWAAREGFYEIVEFLLKNKADPNLNDVWMQANAGHKAGFWGRAKAIELLVAKGLDVNARGGYNGYTAIHDAIARGHVESVKVLLKAGAKLDIKGHDGKTALDLAKAQGNPEILMLLEKKVQR